MISTESVPSCHIDLAKRMEISPKRCLDSRWSLDMTKACHLPFPAPNPCRGAVSRISPSFLPLILAEVPFQGLASSFPPLILADACFQGLEVSICFRQISMQQSLQKNHAFFLQGLLFLYKNAVFEPRIGILAEKRVISSARISTSVNCKAPSTYCRAHPLTEGHLHLSAKEFSFADTSSVYAQISQREPIRFRSRWLI